MEHDKKMIAEKMGDDFVDAIYEGTTADTLTTGLDEALADIARIVSLNGTITVEHAAMLLGLDNPGREYRVDLFKAHLAYCARRAVSVAARGGRIAMTPMDYARQWMRENPQVAQARVSVNYRRPKGKGGRRGMASQVVAFFIADGKIAMTRRKAWWRDQPSYTPRWNGLCNVCGRVYTDLVLQDAWADDPDAGKLYPPRYDGDEDKCFYADQAYVVACPACVEQHHLLIQSRETPYNTFDRWDEATRRAYRSRLHPVLCRYQHCPVEAQINALDDAPPIEVWKRDDPLADLQA